MWPFNIISSRLRNAGTRFVYCIFDFVGQRWENDELDDTQIAKEVGTEIASLIQAAIAYLRLATFDLRVNPSEKSLPTEFTFAWYILMKKYNGTSRHMSDAIARTIKF